jgi:hypothetical protein
MSEKIDINFNFRSDTPPGKDPDTFSPTLRQYHKILWSKPLPNGKQFQLEDTYPKAYLYHQSDLGEFFLTSDAITNSYRNTKKISHIIEQVPDKDVENLYDYGNTIGAYVVFPGKKINNQMTINGARGCNAKIGDRFDLTLECIRLFYDKIENPLTPVFKRYGEFFDLFDGFRGYVNFFFLEDMVTMDYCKVKYHIPHKSFEASPLPANKDEYLEYKENTIDFIKARGKRMETYLLTQL